MSEIHTPSRLRGTPPILGGELREQDARLNAMFINTSPKIGEVAAKRTEEYEYEGL